MSTYQLLYLRFLRLQQDMPHLRHAGHAPIGVEGDPEGAPEELPAQRRRAELEFYRPLESEGPTLGPPSA